MKQIHKKRFTGNKVEGKESGREPGASRKLTLMKSMLDCCGGLWLTQGWVLYANAEISLLFRFPNGLALTGAGVEWSSLGSA